MNKAPRSRFGMRRKIFLGLFLLLVAYAGYAYYAGLAFIAGIPNSEMDWNGDGTVTSTEVAQAWYAVIVKNTRQGQRECNAFYWRGSDEAFRVQCRTTMAPAEEG
ncbi:EF-hand domain-containing protein [Luteimonas sp. SX5]|uniref:EF-hand domain-containing protein n=1 Tax=Luteimonas galliterrae TaxID=2940486 RepID=A0ABT0MK53_9GAMM|nr:EF-hand domain-containing protein [Luteimonas galliterrae]MCL1635241.1 EF-hand domain-containing protein [Luteimonas galliterrae]